MRNIVRAIVAFCVAVSVFLSADNNCAFANNDDDFVNWFDYGVQVDPPKTSLRYGFRSGWAMLAHVNTEVSWDPKKLEYIHTEFKWSNQKNRPKIYNQLTLNSRLGTNISDHGEWHLHFLLKFKLLQRGRGTTIYLSGGSYGPYRIDRELPCAKAERQDDVAGKLAVKLSFHDNHSGLDKYMAYWFPAESVEGGFNLSEEKLGGNIGNSGSKLNLMHLFDKDVVCPTVIMDGYYLWVLTLDGVGNEKYEMFGPYYLNGHGPAPPSDAKATITIDPRSRGLSPEPIEVNVAFTNYIRHRYVWSTSLLAPDDDDSSWSAWGVEPSIDLTQAEAGTWFLHIMAESNNVAKTLVKAIGGPYDIWDGSGGRLSIPDDLANLWLKPTPKPFISK